MKNIILSFFCLMLLGCPYKSNHRLETLHMAENLKIYPTIIDYRKALSELRIDFEVKNLGGSNRNLDFSGSYIVSNRDTFIIHNLLGFQNKKLSYDIQLPSNHQESLSLRFIYLEGFINKHFQLFVGGGDSAYAIFQFSPK